MTLEAPVPIQPQSPEGISPQQKERFNQLLTKITGLKPNGLTVIYTSDSEDPSGGYSIYLGNKGVWHIGFGRVSGDDLNEPGEPVKLLCLLQQYAFIENFSRFDAMLPYEPDPKLASKSTSEYLDERRKLEKSVKDNPGPFAESFLKHMQNALGQLSKE